MTAACWICPSWARRRLTARNVNVSKFGSRCTGPGGFVNISQNTKRVFFTGTFTAGGLKEEVRDGRLVILQEGRSKKFRRQVEQITFSGDYAVKSGQDVTFLTERAVLKLTPDGLMLTEIAPGVELEQDILAQMEFRPLISPELREMDTASFRRAHGRDHYEGTLWETRGSR